MKNKELYDIAESLLNPALKALEFQRHAPPRAYWFRPVRERFLMLHIEVHQKTRWQPHMGGAFNCWMGYTDNPKERIIAPEDSFSLDTWLDDSMLQQRTELRNRVLRKIISTPGGDELSRMLKLTSDELFLFGMQHPVHRNHAGQFEFYDHEDVVSACAMTLQVLPHIISQVETRLATAQAVF